jgi:hypothetical protein
MDSTLSKKRKLKDVNGAGDTPAPVVSKKPKDTDNTEPLSDDGENDPAELEAGNGAAQDALILPGAADSQAFEHLNLSEKTMKAIKDMGFTQMTDIQRRVSSYGTFGASSVLTLNRRLYRRFWQERMCWVKRRQVRGRRWHSSSQVSFNGPSSSTGRVWSLVSQGQTFANLLD